MKRYRSLIIWLVAILVAVSYLLTQPDKTQEIITEDLTLPDDSPDIYITGMDSTRFNTTGEPTLRVKGESLAVYNSEGLSKIVLPVVTLVSNNTDTWSITSETASIDNNENIEFRSNVVAMQLTVEPKLIISSDFLTVNSQHQTISTDLPVQIIQGLQQENAVGMNAKIDTMGAVIHLLSEVTFSYDPQITE